MLTILETSRIVWHELGAGAPMFSRWVAVAPAAETSLAQGLSPLGACL